MDLTFEFAKLKFSTTCRACLNQDGPFLGNEDNKIFQIYTKITGIEVFPLDELPQVICISCGETLKHIGEFIELCQSSDESVRDELRNYHVIKTEHSNDDIKPEPTDPSQEDAEEIIENIFFELQDDTTSVTEPKEEILLEEEQNEQKPRKTRRKLSYICGSCGENFPSHKLRTIHQKNTTCRENEFKCTKCDRIFKFYHKLKAHMQCHTTERQFQCNICMASFRFQANLSRHLKIHRDIKRLQCHICYKEFSEVIKKEEHMTTMHSLTCKCCNIKFKNHTVLRQHLTERLMENVEDEESLSNELKALSKVKCPQCGLILSRKAALRKHLLIHKGEKNFMCSVCGKRFYTRFELEGHSQVHSEEKKFQCPVCGKRFGTKPNFTIHYRIHQGIRPYKCKLCGMSFVQCTQLSRHKKTHTGERPHVCEFCGKRFAQRGNLKVHMKLHAELNQ